MRDTPDVNGLLDLVQRQASASSTLTNCTTFREMAGAIAEHMLLDAGQFITINPLEYSHDGEQFRLLTIATANRHATYDTHEIVELNRSDLGAGLSHIINDGKSTLIENVEKQEDFSPSFKVWLENHKIRALASWPMRYGNRTFGAICLNSLTNNLHLDETAMQLYQVLADQVGALIQLHHLTSEFTYSHEISEGQRRVFDELNPQMDFQAMAGVVARNMLTERGRFVSLIEFFHNNEGLVSGWRTLATANREKTFTWGDAIVNLDWGTIDPTLRDAILEHKPFIVENFDKLSPSFAGEEFYNFFKIINVKAQIIVPVAIVEGRTILGLGILSRTPTTFNQEEINALSNVAEQIGALVRTRHLLEQAQAAQSLATQLAETNREIAAAENYEALAKILMKIMPDTVTDLALALFDKPVVSGERPATLESKVIVSRTGATHLQVVDQIPLHPDVVSTLERLMAGEIIIMPKTSSPILPPITVSLLQAQGVASLTLIGLRIGSRLLGLLMLGSASRLALGVLEQDNFRTVADQVAISIENRSLLDQTGITLNFVQTQFEATSAIYDAKTPLETLEAVYRFVGGQFKHSHLGLVDANNASVVHIVAEIHHGQSNTEEHEVEISSYPAFEALPALETLYVPDVVNDTFLTEAERTRLQSQDIGGLIIVPLMANQRAVGLITFMSPVPATIPPNRLRALRNLADQAAVVFDNRTLLASTAATLDETRLLYEVNRSVLSAQDTLDVLRTIREHIAPEASNINHISIAYDSLGQIKDATIDFMNMAGGAEQVINISLAQTIGEKKIASLQAYWESRPSAVSFVEDMDAVYAEHPLAEFSLNNGSHSSISILIRENTRVRETVTVAFSYPQRFDDRQRRFYEAISDQIAIVLQNHRLLRDAQVTAAQLSRQVQTLQTINQFGSVINAITDEKTLLDTSAELVVELLGIDHCGIVLVVEDGAYGVVSSEYPPHGSLGAKVATVNNPLWGELQSDGEFKPLVIPDVSLDDRIEPLSRKAFSDLGIHSMAILPLVVHNELIGGVGLDIYTQDRSVSSQMVEIGQIVTAQINLGLQNVRLLTEAHRRAEQLQHIASFSQSAQATFDPADIFDTLLNESAQMLPISQMSIMLYDSVRQELRTVAERVDNKNRIQLTDGELVPISGPIGQVWSTRETLHIPDLRKSGQPVNPAVTVRSWIMTPILSRGRVTGLVSVGSNRPFAYADTDVALFSQMISQLAAAIENAEAYQQSQRIAKNEALVNDISTQLQRQMDLRSMLDITASELGKVLGARKARIRLATHVPENGEAE